MRGSCVSARSAVDPDLDSWISHTRRYYGLSPGDTLTRRRPRRISADMPKRKPSPPAPAKTPAERLRQYFKTHRIGRRYGALVLHLLLGWGAGKVAAVVPKVSAKRIRAWIGALDSTGKLDDSKRSRKSVVSEADLEKVKQKLSEPSGKRRPYSSLKKSLPRAVREGAAAHHRTTYARALKRGGWIYQPNQKTPALTEAKKRGRVEFCAPLLRRPDKRNTIAFSDSKIFCGELSSKSSLGKSWAPKGQPRQLPLKQKAAYQAHVYAAITKYGGTKLVFVSGTRGPKGGPRGRPKKPAAAAPAAAAPAAAVTDDPPEDGAEEVAGKLVSATEYRNDVLPRLLPECKTLFQSNGISTWRWQQDGARPHTVASTTLGKKNRELIEKYATLVEPWPASSPDLSPIEKCWAIAEEELNSMDWSDFNGFKRAVEAA